MAEETGPEADREKRRRMYNVYRAGLLVFTSLYTFFYAGAFFGYGPMILLLQRDGAFSSTCDSGEPTCPDQTSQLLNIHFVGTLMQIITPFVGHLCDTRGAFATMLYTSATGLAGVAMLIVSRAVPMDELLYPAFCFLGLNTSATSVMCVVTGGVFRIYDEDHHVLQTKAASMIDEETKTSSQEPESSSHHRNDVSGIAQVVTEESKVENGNGVGDNSKEQCDESQDKGPRRVIGLLNNLFDAGSITYLILWEAHKSLGSSLQVLCYWYLGAGVFMFGGALACWMLVLRHQAQDKMIQENVDDMGKPLTTVAVDKGNILTEQQEAPLPDNNDGRLETSEEPPRMVSTDELVSQQEPMEEDSKEEWKQLFSASYLWLVAFFAFHVGRNQFVLTSAEAFLNDLGDTGDKYITIFTMIMPASILGFPFVDWALGRYGYHSALQLINLLGLVHGTIQISATDNLDVQIIGFIVFSFYRCFLFSVIFAYLSVLMPEKVLGKANGIMHISSGVSGLLNIPLGNAAVKQWNGSFFIPNCIYTFGIIPLFYAAYGTTRGIRSHENQGSSRQQASPSSALDDEVAKA